MKRHKGLHPLSHDHHHALVQARQLNLAGAQTEQGVAHAAAEQFIAFWEGDLQNHFRQEEDILLPVLETYVARDCAEIRETLKQHTEIRRLIDELKTELTRHGAIDAVLLGQIGGALTDHIRFEENELFPVVEARVPERELWEINEKLKRDA